MAGVKDYTRRANVVNFLPWWISYVKERSIDRALFMLKNHKTRYLTRKDEIGLKQALVELEGLK